MNLPNLTSDAFTEACLVARDVIRGDVGVARRQAREWTPRPCPPRGEWPPTYAARNIAATYPVIWPY